MASIPIKFVVPKGGGNERKVGVARSEEKLNYLIHLNLLFELKSGTGRGSALVSGAVNGQRGAQIDFDVKPVRALGVRATWDSIDLIHGVRTGDIDGKVRISYVNYLPFNSVRPGLNRLTFRLEVFGHINVARAIVLGGSGVEVSELSPAQIRLVPSMTDEAPVIGEPFGVRFSIQNTGERPAYNVETSLEDVGTGVKVVGRHKYTFRRLNGTKTGEFFTRAVRPGKIHMRLRTTTGNANSPAASLVVDVASERSARGLVQPWVLSLLILICGGVVWGVWRRLRGTSTASR